MLDSSLLSGWVNFYVIVGSSAGALTGLQFVVITLVTEARAASSMREISAFASPTVVQFCMALFISGIMAAPWHALSNIGVCLATCGIAGLAYSLAAIRHARKSNYTPDAEDWFWYTILPLLTYSALIAAAILFWWRPFLALFMTAGITFVFLFTGIHNAWDTVTYIALQRHKTAEDKPDVQR